MICQSCNSDIPDGYKFCPKCGKRTELRAPATDKTEKDNGPGWIWFIALLALAGLTYAGITAYTYYKVKTMAARGEIEYKRHQYKLCITDLNYVVRKNLKRSTPARLTLARCYFENEQYDQAVKQIEDAAGWDSKNPEILALWAEFLYMAGKYELAVKKGQEALKTNRNNRAALQSLGIAQLMIGDFHNGEANLKKALKKAAPEDKTKIYNKIAESRFRRGDDPGAIASYNNSLKVYMNQYDVLLELSKIYYQRKEYRDCYTSAKRARHLVDARTSKNWNKADKLVQSCWTFVKTFQLEDCFKARRELDRTFYVLYNEVALLEKQYNESANDEFAQDMGGGVELVLSRANKLQEDYRALTCPTDDDKKNFKVMQTLMMGQTSRLVLAIETFQEFISSQSEEDMETYRNIIRQLNQELTRIFRMWKEEEKIFHFEPMMEERPEEPAAQKTKTGNL